jgi:hypothetical protein
MALQQGKGSAGPNYRVLEVLMRSQIPNRSKYLVTALLLVLFTSFLFGISRTAAIEGEPQDASPAPDYWYFRGVVNDMDFFWSSDFALFDELLALDAAGQPMARDAEDRILGVYAPPTLLGTWFAGNRMIQAYGYNYEAGECYLLTLDSALLDAKPVRAVWVDCAPIVAIYEAIYDVRRGTTENDL